MKDWKQLISMSTQDDRGAQALAGKQEIVSFCIIKWSERWVCGVVMTNRKKSTVRLSPQRDPWISQAVTQTWQSSVPTDLSLVIRKILKPRVWDRKVMVHLLNVTGKRYILVSLTVYFCYDTNIVKLLVENLSWLEISDFCYKEKIANVMVV